MLAWTRTRHKVRDRKRSPGERQTLRSGTTRRATRDPVKGVALQANWFRLSSSNHFSDIYKYIVKMKFHFYFKGPGVEVTTPPTRVKNELLCMYIFC